MLKRGAVVPMNEILLDSAAQAELEAAREWRKNNPATATDLAALAFKLGINDEYCPSTMVENECQDDET